jgi:hypothetical protein
MQSSSEDEEPAPPPPKKKRENLRVGKTAEERQYADTKERLLAAARAAVAIREQQDRASLEQDQKRKQKQELLEEVKRDKRAARFERSQARKQRLHDAAAASISDKKKMLNEAKKKGKRT